MMLRRREGGRTGRALAASLVLHAGVLGSFALASGPPRAPREKVIAVEIVSPPPNVAGEKMAEPPATQEPAPAAPAQPEPAPEPPAPDPTPPAPRPEPAKEPEKAPEPRREPQRPPQRPTPPARREPEKGTQPDRTQGQGARTGPATGTTPRPDAAGGEGITVRTDGDPCPVQGYCENVTRQVRRFFRPPPESAGGRGEVCFRIQRDGRVTDISTQRVRGSASFRIAMMEAAEAAGSRQAFGTLPGAFDPARWRWCVELSPS